MSIKKKPSGKYQIDLHLKSGGRLRMVGYTDRRASLKLEENIIALDSCIVAGERPDRNLTEWLEALPERTKEKLARHGLISKVSLERSKTIQEHLEIFIAYKSSQASRSIIKPKQVKVMKTRLNKLIDQCNISCISDISQRTIENWMTENTINNTFAPKTINHYITAFKQFSSWLYKNNISTEDTLAGLQKININSGNITFTRRALTENEINSLVHEAKTSSVTRCGVTGTQRALAYQISLFTGLRYNEAATLRRDDIDLETKTIRCRDINSKNGHTTTLPLQDELASELKAYFSDNPVLPFANIFPHMPEKGIDLLKKDLESANIPYETEEGRADFHSLRHTFCTMLAKSGVLPQVGQKLMRHSDIKLTMTTYTHLLLEDQRMAVSKLPSLNIQPNIHASTGTDDILTYSEIDQNKKCPKSDQIMSKSAVFNNNRMNSNGQSEQNNCNSQNHISTCIPSTNPTKKGIKRTLNASDTSSQDWRSERDSNPRWREPRWFSKPDR